MNVEQIVIYMENFLQIIESNKDWILPLALGVVQFFIKINAIGKDKEEYDVARIVHQFPTDIIFISLGIITICFASSHHYAFLIVFLIFVLFFWLSVKLNIKSFSFILKNNETCGISLLVINIIISLFFLVLSILFLQGV